jgi:hypothetical protein
MVSWGIMTMVLAIWVCLYFPPSVSELPRFLPSFLYFLSSLSILSVLLLFRNFPLVLSSFFPLSLLQNKKKLPLSFVSSLLLFHSNSPPFSASVESSIYRANLAVARGEQGSGLLSRMGSRGRRVRSPMGVALQGTPALFSIHGILGFGSSMQGERGETVYIYIYIYCFYLFCL